MHELVGGAVDDLHQVGAERVPVLLQETCGISAEICGECASSTASENGIRVQWAQLSSAPVRTV